MDDDYYDYIEEDMLDELKHIGVPRRSGRYPWGSGEDRYQNSASFAAGVKEMKRQGLTEAQIAEGLGLNSSTELRAAMSVAKAEKIASDTAMVYAMHEKGMSNTAIAERLGVTEGTVRNYLKAPLEEKASSIALTSSVLKKQLDAQNGDFIDVGTGVDIHMGISREKMNAALYTLEAEGKGVVHNVKVPQLGTGDFTTTKVLCPPGTTWQEAQNQQHRIKNPTAHTEDDGRTFGNIVNPISINPKRVMVRFGPEGGAEKDGLIEVRPGVEDLSMGPNRYAQVRVAVGPNHYLKGMAVYRDDLPDGVDMVFNTNKDRTKNKLDAMKPMKMADGKPDPENPFGSNIARQITKFDKNGKEVATSAMNIVNDESDWSKWSRSLSSQMLSKQAPALAKEQLEARFERRKNEYDTIMAMTNPAIKKKLLLSLGDQMDADAVSLKAAALPKTKAHVLIPIPSLKDNEVFAPSQYKDGDTVVLIRHPHGGRFEIPELTVNNRNREARKVIGTDALTAIGVNSKVAQKLSGADFDGDTVLVIPNPHNRRNRISVVNPSKTNPLKELETFDPKTVYRETPGMKYMSKRGTQLEMGKISNLITDMSIKGASDAELARAVKHSMVVIDAERHKLNYKASEERNGIKALKAKYQDGGASTIISRAGSEVHLPDRKPRPAAQGGPIDKATGKKMYVPSGATRSKRVVDEKTGEVTWVKEPKKTEYKKMEITDDAYTLVSSPSPKRIETIYADHANKMKALANESRRVAVNMELPPRSRTAAQTYAPQVESLMVKLRTAQENAPRERQAQIVANTVAKQRIKASPEATPEDIKKIKYQSLEAARKRTGAVKANINIDPKEWEAIQAHAISKHRLEELLRYTNVDVVKELAMPRASIAMPTSKVSRARSMLSSGYTHQEVAKQMGVSVSTLTEALK